MFCRNVVKNIVVPRPSATQSVGKAANVTQNDEDNAEVTVLLDSDDNMPPTPNVTQSASKPSVTQSGSKPSVTQSASKPSVTQIGGKCNTSESVQHMTAASGLSDDEDRSSGFYH